MSEPVLTLEPEYLRLSLEIFDKILPGHEIWAFGSRVQGRVKPYSDIDFVVIGEHEIAPEIMGRLRDAFADSDLPYKVDVVDWATLTPAFRRSIESAKIVLRS